MNLTDVKTIKELLTAHNLRPSHALGQNFLVNERVLQKIVAAAELQPSDTVVEIGAGLGTLTRELAKQAGRVIAFEIDKKLLPILRENLQGANNIEILEQNFLSAKLPEVKYKVVANLPYQITSAILEKFLESAVRPELMVLLVQKEVAERICASASRRTGETSLLSVAVQYYGQPKIIAHVPAGAFWPTPRVESAVLKVVMRPEPLLEDKRAFFKIVKAGFSRRRAMLKNNLRPIIPEERLLGIFRELNLSPKIRAEELAVEQWQRIARLWYNL